MARSAWTAADLKFLRSLRIDPGDPPEHRRFVAVEGAQGWWHVIDREDGNKRIRHFGPSKRLDPKETAHTIADRLNTEDVTKK